MKKTLIKNIIFTAALSFVIAAPAFAETAPIAAQHDAGQFNAHKQKLLGNIGEHIAKMQKKQSCINDAVDEKTLSACFSADNENVHRDGKAGGPGKQ